MKRLLPAAHPFDESRRVHQARHIGRREVNSGQKHPFDFLLRSFVKFHRQRQDIVHPGLRLSGRESRIDDRDDVVVLLLRMQSCDELLNVLE